jgi:gliding motility-associated lipoprotein GldD
MYKGTFFWIAIMALFYTASCNTPYVAKQKGYSAITLPVNKGFIKFNQAEYPYEFEYPSYAMVDNKVNYFGKDMKSDAWLNLRYPTMNATLFISYNRIPASQPHLIDTLMRDAYKLVNNHTNMASFIEDSIFTTDAGVKGVFFHLGGDVATPYQFFLTDSTNHFFRAALYYETLPNEDSLAPINTFIYKDLQHLMRSFRWK